MKISYCEVLCVGLCVVLLVDECVFLMGEDVGCYGGVYVVSKGLFEEFGEVCICDMLLFEVGFVGVGIGVVINGMWFIVEVMMVNFSLLVLD